MEKNFHRRHFLKSSTHLAAGAVLSGASLSGCADLSGRLLHKPKDIEVKPLEVVRIGFVGVGGIGSHHVKLFLGIEGAEVRAVCDIVPEKVAQVQEWTVAAGQPKPTGYSRNEYDFKRLCQEEELDLVFTATPWRWHVPVCVAAMKAGKHAATEVPAAVTLDDCWQLVETAEKTGRYCVMMENCCYDRVEMMILNMVRKGLLGELLHAECGYLHDLRPVKFGFEGVEGLWRTAHSIKRNGDLYPTHGLGPVAQCMNINRGNLFDYLVSTSCNAKGLNLYAEDKFGADDPRATQKYALGDVVTTLIRTVNGQTIVVKHDTNSPRPYSRDIYMQGTKGLVVKYPESKIYIEGKSPVTDLHDWEPLENYSDPYEHPLWRSEAVQVRSEGHGGMDYLEDYRLVHCLRTGTPPDMDVYDAAAWSAVSELSERSIAKGSRPMTFPDFTRGKWKTNKPLGIIQPTG
jgi:predicted dehydrogenase